MLVTDGKGTPLGQHVDSASPCETTLLSTVLADVPVPRTRLPRLIADRGYDSDPLRRTLDQRIATLDYEIASLRGATVVLDHVAATLTDFDGLWDVLIPAERSRLVQLLVERVVGSVKTEIPVVFHTTTRQA